MMPTSDGPARHRRPDQTPYQLAVRDDVEMFRQRMSLLPNCVERTRLLSMLEKIEDLAATAAGKAT